MAETLVEKLTKTPEGMREYQQECLILAVTEAIAEAMQERNINKGQLAAILGKPNGYIKQLLAGTTNMTLRTVADVFTALGKVLHVRHITIEETIGRTPRHGIEALPQLCIDKLLPEAEVCRRLGKDPSTLWRYRCGKGGRPVLRAHRIFGKVYYAPEDLDRFVRESRISVRKR